ncbi:MAG: sialate O-acetylesterase [Planctomycetota bacterium]|nr:sialate O-acetylesterase [Planctomycetota bacterium]
MFLSQLLFLVTSVMSQPIDEPQPIQIFLLAGQSNMEGQAVVDLVHEEHYNGGNGTLIRLLEDPAMAKRMGHLRQSNGEWTVRDDVWVRYRTGNDVLKSGPLSIGYAVYDDPHHFGPELQMGHILGDAIEAPILLIKTCWGGKSLHVDFRPPSAGGETGPYYQKMIAEYREALEAIDTEFPQLAGRPRKLSGFVWFQGWNDMFTDGAVEAYEQNMAHLIDDLRKELKAPDLPVVIGETGNGNSFPLRHAQAAVAERPEYRGNVSYVGTAQFLRRPQDGPNVGHGHHWFGNAESYFGIGDVFGREMLRMLTGGRAEGSDEHPGPAVAAGDEATARWASTLFEAYSAERAFESIAYTDQWYREPGNEGFEATLDHVLEHLRSIGFGQDKKLQLEVIETPMRSSAWTPRSAQLKLLVDEKPDQILLSFRNSKDIHRTMLPVNAPSCNVEGPICFDTDQLKKGDILVTDRSIGQAMRVARSRGAIAVLSSYLASFTVDPTGGDRHLDAIHYTSVRRGDFPVAMISPRVHSTLRENPGGRVSLQARVVSEKKPLRTIVATVIGTSIPEEAIALAAHVQEPGAVDNASGVGGQLEGARSLVTALKQGKVDWPRRSISFIWGDEMTMSRVYLDHTQRKTIVAFSADMIGASQRMTGAIALLERSPDPGALKVLPPDSHTPWGAGRVDRSDLKSSGVSTIARLAMHDVAAASNGWVIGEHPWEGGSDHDVFLGRDIPAILMWHFTDFAYHTSLDRLSHVDPGVVRRMSVALLTAALAVADPEPQDLDRYRKSVELERELRINAARGDDELVELWNDWCDEEIRWFSRLCLRKSVNGGR